MRTAILATLLISVPRIALTQGAQDRYTLLPHVGLQAFSTDRLGLFGGVTYRPSLESDREGFWAAALGGELGIAGGELNLGVARHLRPIISDVGGLGSDFSIKGQLAYLRTWGNPAHVGPRQSFLGPEVQVMWSIVGVRIGYFSRLSGHTPNDASFFTVGVVLGWH